jgi:ubiquinone/menaquinone biosynthesis C-methylase UbiE
MTNERWERAQIAEKKFWISTKKSWSTQNQTQYWRSTLDHGFSLDYDFFLGKSVLEVGCGPVGIVFELGNAKSRIGLEPMDLDDFVNDEKKSIVKKGLGEEIPFPDNYFDIVISFNALDHSVSPPKVVQEIHRVLRKGGDFLLWIYVLRNHFQFLQRLLNMMDPPHPFHFTVDQLLTPINDSSFEIKSRKEDKGTGLPNNTVKKAIANQMMNTLWLWLNKKP